MRQFVQVNKCFDAGGGDGVDLTRAQACFDNRVELVKSGLVLAIERSYGSTLDATVVDGAFTCAARR